QIGHALLDAVRRCRHFVGGSLQRALGARAVVALDVDHERVFELPRFLHRVDQATDLMVGIGQVSRIDFHHARIESLLVSGQGVHAGIPSGRVLSLVLGGTTPSLIWRASVSSRTLSQPWSNCPLYLSIHSFGAWCGACADPVAK